MEDKRYDPYTGYEIKDEDPTQEYHTQDDDPYRRYRYEDDHIEQPLTYEQVRGFFELGTHDYKTARPSASAWSPLMWASCRC